MGKTGRPGSGASILRFGVNSSGTSVVVGADIFSGKLVGGVGSSSKLCLLYSRNLEVARGNSIGPAQTGATRIARGHKDIDAERDKGHICKEEDVSKQAAEVSFISISSSLRSQQERPPAALQDNGFIINVGPSQSPGCAQLLFSY